MRRRGFGDELIARGKVVDVTSEFKNRTFAQIEVGTTVTFPHRLTRMDLDALLLVSGEVDPFHMDAEGRPKKEIVAETVAAEALLSALLKRRLPGPGTTIVSQELRFSGTLSVGDEVTGTVTARDKHQEGNLIVFDCRVDRGGEDIISGTVTVAAPTEHISYSQLATPQVILRRHDAFARLFSLCKDIPPVTCAVVHPCDRNSLLGALQAAERGLIEPTLVGPESKIRAVAEAEGVDLTPYRIVSTEHSLAAAQKAVAMVRAGEIESLMKGSLHTDELLSAVVPSATGLRTARRISHVFIMDVPTYPRMLRVTDAAINMAPAAKEKADIVQNAIDLAHVLGIEQPRVAILAAVETVNPEMQATIDAAVLCKMADRGQITGGILDGPLAFDNAVSEEAARIKKIVSPVAGRADILLVPDLEAGNILAKQLEYLAGANAAGIVLGTRVPIVLTSRADTARTRLTSAAVMKLIAESRRTAIGTRLEVAHA
jgi:phosphotransacetylase/acyl dehydratase